MRLRDKDKKRLIAIARNSFRTPLEIWIYGSRVMDGNAHDASDLDIVLRSHNLVGIDPAELMQFKKELSESNIPILIQVFDWNNLPENFHKNIMEKHEVLLDTRQDGRIR